MSTILQVLAQYLKQASGQLSCLKVSAIDIPRELTAFSSVLLRVLFEFTYPVEELFSQLA